MNLLNISYGYYHMRVRSRLDAETDPMVEMPEITRLTPEERLELIGRLWDSLEFEDVRLTPSQDAELGRRMATFEADAKTAVAWEEIEADLIRRSS